MRGRGMRWRRVAPVLVAVLVGTMAVPPPAGAATTLGPAALARGADHACVVGPGRPRLGALRNPVVFDPAAGVKDEAVVWHQGRWHLVASEVTGDRTTAHWHIATATSPDLVHWSALRTWPAQAGTLGVASPDVVRAPDGGFVVTYQSDPGAPGGGGAQLFFRTSADLETFGPPHPLAPGLAGRMIDGALAFTGHGVVLGFKAGTVGATQAFTVAWSPSGSLAGPWRVVGRPDIEVDGGTVENYEFVWAAGAWRLVATSNNLDQPWIFTLAGDPADPAAWLHWTGGRELVVPAEGWDHGPGLSSVTYEQDNSAYLCVDGPTDLLFYAGSPELTDFGGWGHAAVGMARSTDLVHWVPAPAR